MDALHHDGAEAARLVNEVAQLVRNPFAYGSRARLDAIRTAADGLHDHLERMKLSLHLNNSPQDLQQIYAWADKQVMTLSTALSDARVKRDEWMPNTARDYRGPPAARDADPTMWSRVDVLWGSRRRGQDRAAAFAKTEAAQKALRTLQGPPRTLPRRPRQTTGAGGASLPPRRPWP